MKKLCIDVGGTFTDCLVLDESGELHKFKAPTTPGDPTVGFFDAVGKAGRRDGQRLEEFLSGVEMIVHGTTLGRRATTYVTSSWSRAAELAGSTLWGSPSVCRSAKSSSRGSQH